MYFKAKHINLRALEPEDIDWLFDLENDETYWSVSFTQQPFSKHLLKNYIENAKQSIFEAQQLRLVVEVDKIPVGLIDLYDFDAFHQRAGVGIIITTDHQNKKYATEALQLIIRYGFDYLHLHQLFAQISDNNKFSLSLFQKAGFQITGTKKDWNIINNQPIDEHFLQLISDKI